MPRMFFHLVEHDSVTRDEEGRETADLKAARVIAIHAARDVMCAEISEGRLSLRSRIDVLDAQGDRLMSLPFNEAIPDMQV